MSVTAEALLRAGDDDRRRLVANLTRETSRAARLMANLLRVAQLDGCPPITETPVDMVASPAPRPTAPQPSRSEARLYDRASTGRLDRMPSVLFRESSPAVDELVEERRRTGVDRLDEVWEGVYVVNPPPSFRHSTVAGLIVDLFRPHAAARGLVVVREVGVGRPDDYRIPDVVVASTDDLDDLEHYLLTAAIAVEVLSPTERVDKRPFYLSHGVAEVILVDAAAGAVEWLARGPATTGYQPVAVSAVLPVGSADVAALLGS